MAADPADGEVGGVLASVEPRLRLPSPGVELLVWSGCPSHERALELLRAALHDLLRDDDARVQVRVRQVETDEEAVAERFVGSPTVRVDGADVIPPDPGESYALTCRVYRLRDGRYSPTPDPQDLRAALAAHLTPASPPVPPDQPDPPT